MSEQTLQQRVAAALTEPLTAKQCGELIMQVQKRAAQVELRLEAIRPAKSATGSCGPERQRILATGSPDDVKALEAEYDTLAVEDAQLKAQREELRQRRQQARVSEAVDGMPDRYKVFSAKLAAAENARQAFTDALQAVDAAYIDIEQARYTANAARAALPPAPAGVLEKIEALRPWTGLVQSRLWVRNCNPASALGLEEPRRALL